jgi:Ca-activated chloride channel family protein
MTNPMTHDDPRLIAYALNELEDADRAVVEAFLAGDETARRFVEETRQTAAMLSRTLQSVPTPTLTVEQRQAIAAAAAAPAAGTRALNYQSTTQRSRAPWARWALATAACAALAAGGFAMLRGPRAMTPRGTVAGPASQPQVDAESRRITIAALSERSQEQTRKRNYEQALGILQQILDLDPSNDYARGAYPLVYDLFQRYAVREHRELRNREVTNQLNQAEEKKIPYEDILRYPENWPDLSLSDRGSGGTGGGGGGRAGRGASGGQTGKDFLDASDPAAVSLGYHVDANSAADPSQPGQQASSGNALSKTGAGTLTFQNATGATPVTSGGVLTLGDKSQPIDGTGLIVRNGVVNASTTVQVPDGGTLLLGGQTLAEGVTFDIGQKSSGNGTVTVAGVNNYTGTTTINGGTLVTRGTANQGLAPTDFSGIVAHYHNRSPDGMHLLDGGVVDGKTQTEFEKDQPGKPASAASEAPFPKNQTAYRFIQGLRSAREALARNDQNGARAAVAQTRGWLEKETVQLTPAEFGEYTVALRQVEAAIPGTESYALINDNPFNAVIDQPLSTFSIDVDTASYANVRRFIDQGQLPPPDAVRIEEMLNYFPYSYEKPAPDSKEPFKAAVEVAGCPWNTAHRLARVAIKGREIAHDKRPVSNLVFLVDVSGSMNEPKKLPLVKEGLKLMVNELTENDRISIVVYAGNAGLVLPSTCADPKSKDTILAAIDNLSAGGSTNGGQGIELAYKIATDNFIKGGTNRVLLATDGDWNVGVTDQSSLINLIQDKAKSGVFLSVLGYGFGNLKDSTMEKLADKGNGHYAYIDSIKEARKVLVEEMSGTLVTIAKDVKIQVEFNPAKVESYRLIGYENRMLRKEDFNNDKIDAGEIGAGHCVTALYELVPATKASAPATRPVAATQPEVDALKYQKHELVDSGDLMTLKLRYKQPDGDTSTKIEIPATDKGLSYSKASEDFKFTAAVAQFGMILRNSAHKGTASLDGVIELADEGKGKDEKGYRGEFVELARKAKALSK